MNLLLKTIVMTTTLCLCLFATAQEHDHEDQGENQSTATEDHHQGACINAKQPLLTVSREGNVGATVVVTIHAFRFVGAVVGIVVHAIKVRVALKRHASVKIHLAGQRSRCFGAKVCVGRPFDVLTGPT